MYGEENTTPLKAHSMSFVQSGVILIKICLADAHI